MALKPEVSVGVGLAVAAMVGAVWVNATPSLTDVRAAPPNDRDVSAGRKVAAWTSFGLVGFTSLITKDPNVFIMGGATTIAFDWWYRHANLVNPAIGKATAAAARLTQPAQTQAQAPADYGYAGGMESIVGGY